MKKIVPTALLSLALATSLGACSGESQSTSGSITPHQQVSAPGDSHDASSSPVTHVATSPTAAASSEQGADGHGTGGKTAREAASILVKSMPLSRSATLQRLTSPEGDGYSQAEAEKALDSLHVNWNEQARKAAVSYLEFMKFDCKGMKEQLSQSYSDAFTQKEADWGADHTPVCHIAKVK